MFSAILADRSWRLCVPPSPPERRKLIPRVLPRLLAQPRSSSGAPTTLLSLCSAWTHKVVRRTTSHRHNKVAMSVCTRRSAVVRVVHYSCVWSTVTDRRVSATEKGGEMNKGGRGGEGEKFECVSELLPYAISLQNEHRRRRVDAAFPSFPSLTPPQHETAGRVTAARASFQPLLSFVLVSHQPAVTGPTASEHRAPGPLPKRFLCACTGLCGAHSRCIAAP